MKIKCPICKDEFPAEEIKNHLATSLSNKEVLKLIDAYVDREIKIHEMIAEWDKVYVIEVPATDFVKDLKSLLEDNNK